MLTRLLKADLARGAVVALTLTALITLAAALMSASTALIINTLSATNQLYERAKVPDLIQMHTGDVEPQKIADWVSHRDDINQYEVIKTLPAPRQALWLAGVNQIDSYHEPAFVTSPQRIDLLLDEDGNPITPAPGQVALPIHYLITNQAKVGDTLTIDTGDWKIDLEIMGFIRDAQMNAAMVPSKRLVVNPDDFATLDAQINESEYLIEFALTEGTRPTTVIDEYKAAGLPSTGIHIDSTMLQLMNALSTMIIAAVALIVAFVLIIVSMLALRYTILAAIEADLTRIAVLKAIGAPQNQIRRLYILKYLVLAAVGSIIGYLLGLPLARALGAPTMLYMGNPPTTLWSIGIPILTVALMVAAIIGFTWTILKRIGKISAIEALRSGTSGSLGKNRRLWKLTNARRLPLQQWLGVRESLRSTNGLLLGVLALCTFTMILPTAVTNTLENPTFATYLGSGASDLRIDVRAGAQDLTNVENVIASDDRIAKHNTILRRNYQISTADGQWESVLIDIGDHNMFPMKYLSGRAPTNDKEISLSYNQAESVGAKIGDTVTTQVAGSDRRLEVTGIYQDITNNGHTAKATFNDGSPALWQIIYADLKNPEQETAVTSDLSKQLPGVQVTAMSTYASQFFGATSSQLRLISGMALAIALGLAFLITVLFTVLVLSRERVHIGVLKALGCTNRNIASQYFTRFGILTLLGIGLGLLLAFVLGEPGIGLVLASRGAPHVELLPNLWLVGLAMPLALILTVTSAVALAVRHLNTITLTNTE